MTEKPRVLFVGAFASDPKSKVRGGQAAACLRLLETPLKARAEWELVDSTMRSLPPPGMWIRGTDAARRVGRVAWTVGRRRPHAALVFSSFSSTSLAEKGLMCALSRLRSVPTVLFLRSEIVPLASPWHGLVKRLLVTVETFVCQTEIAKERLVALYGVAPQRILIIPNWMDPTPYASIERTPRTGPVEILYAGWMERWKGPEDLLSAAQRLSGVRVVMCGEGSMLPALRRQAQGMPNVEFRGWLKHDDMLEAYRSADVFCMPSHTEGMPNAVLEAMAAGLPVVATRAGGLPAMIEDEQTGLLVDPRRPRQLADALARVVATAELRQTLGARARSYVAKHHDTQVVWPKLAAVLGL